MNNLELRFSNNPEHYKSENVLISLPPSSGALRDIFKPKYSMFDKMPNQLKFLYLHISINHKSLCEVCLRFIQVKTVQHPWK